MNSHPEQTNADVDLGSDLPLIDPADDAFGYAPFASQLANAIVGNKSPQGLVLAVHGEWGSGKSSLLNFIKHDLRNLPEERRPVLIDFNPWWFEGREQIASQLLEQFSAQLPDRLKNARSLAKLVGKYSQQIASAAADFSGFGWIKMPLSALLGWVPGIRLLTDKTTIPQIKRKVAASLKESGKRFVFFVDDIDRLTPDESRDLFRAIKALADFPEVVYVLFFDRNEVSRALNASLKMDGEAYLEKIVQAPFHLPAVDKGLLHQKLFTALDAVIESRPMPFPFDQQRWAELFSNGLERCVRKPRDIVRIHNAISVTYPPLAGEVNPVDFIALEFLRVFEPAAYGSIRDNGDAFCGSMTQVDYEKASEKAYFEKWRESLPEPSRAWVVELVGRLFPKVAEALNTGRFFSGGDHREWRRELRACSPDCFGVYFQFALSSRRVSRGELDRLASQESSESMAALLLEAMNQILPDGHSKARDLIDRLRDFDEIAPVQAGKLVEALVATAHLLLRKEDEGGFFAFPNRWRIMRLATDLLERLDARERENLLARLAAESQGLWAMVDLADTALEGKRNPSKAPKCMLDVGDGFPEFLVAAVAKRLDEASLEQLMSMPELSFVVHRWNGWGDRARIREVFKPMLVDDDKLLQLVDKFVRTGMVQSGKQTTETYQLSMNPLAAAVDVHAIEPRLRALQSRPDLTPRQQGALSRFATGLHRMAEGKDPDGSYFDDPED